MLLSKLIPLVATFVSGAWAQFPQAMCASGFDWNKNSLGQDPCLVGSMLDAACRGLAQYTFPPLNATQYYLPPSTNHSGDVTCDCNTVMYSIYMACIDCQAGSIYAWTQWVPQCNDGVYISEYPVDIAQGTAIPYWAYYNVTTLPNELWNSTIAENLGRDPETKPKPINTIDTSSRTSSTGGPKSTLTKTSEGGSGPTDVTNDTKGGTNVGAIVGGVVGTIVPLSILAVIIFLVIRHRRQNAVQQTGYMMPMPNPEEEAWKQRPVSYGPAPVTNFTPYNPADPSTFPPQSPPTSITYTTPPTNGVRGGYAGMPEV